MIRLLLATSLILGCVVAASAQCPGGNCGGAAFSSPQVQYYMQPRVVYQQQYYAVPHQQFHYQQSTRVVQSSGPNWTYPGSVASHLQRDHGVNVSGMSHAQMVQLHNNLHNSGTSRSRTVVRTRQGFFRRF